MQGGSAQSTAEIAGTMGKITMIAGKFTSPAVMAVGAGFDLLAFGVKIADASCKS